MEKMDVFNKICKIINDVCNIEMEEIKMESEIMEDLDISSFEMLAVVAEIQNVFSIKIYADKLNNIYSIEDLVDFVCDEIG